MESKTPSVQDGTDTPEQGPSSISAVVKPPKQAGLSAALRVNTQAPFPWNRAISAGLASAIPILIGILLGHYTYGLVANMGGLAYLYTSDEPYARRAIKLLTVMLALAFSSALGSLGAALSVWSAALVLGLVGLVSVLVCDALQVPPPSALFFIFTCAVGTAMPTTDPAALVAHAGLIVLGGIPAWLISMSGWIRDPHGPETQAVTRTYRALARWLAAVGTDQFHTAQHLAAMALRSSETVLGASSIPRRRAGSFTRLMRLHAQADALFLAIIELSAASDEQVDPKLTAAVRALADAVDDPDRAASLTIPQPLHPAAALERVCRELSAAVAIAADEEPAPARHHRMARGSVGDALAAAFDRNSLIVPRALRFGAVLLLAYLAAYAWRAERPYWVFFSSAAVMMGPSTTATLHRAVQRTVGTVGGALLGVSIFAFNPSGMMMALSVLLLQTIAQLMLVRNYALAVTFLTPLGLLLAHGGHPEYSTDYLVTARIVDIILGCAIGLVGTMLFGGRLSSKRLPVLLSDTIRREGSLVKAMLAGQGREAETDRHKLRTSLLNLRVIYDAAVNEIGGNRSRVESLWPAVVAVQRLGFFLISLTDQQWRQHLSRESLGHLCGVFDTLAGAVEAGRPPQVEQRPILPEYPVISHELQEISQGLQVLQLAPR